MRRRPGPRARIGRTFSKCGMSHFYAVNVALVTIG
ncbi:hypothetical protein RHCRD62_20023 [Rhodococcus sp. RD6.2]|nr:hypothetical protein RHCRD62_20023 [Rhodococcus sp. RD6.2]